MNRTVNKIVILIAVIIIAVGLYEVVLPYLSSLYGDSAQKIIVVSQSGGSNTPIFFLSNDKKIRVTIADSESEREEGLSGTPFLPDDQGMLFVFEQPDFYSIWMKDMIYPLDIIWLDKNFKIVDIKKNIEPSTYPDSFTPSQKSLYVLEINAGASDTLGLHIGDTPTLTN